MSRVFLIASVSIAMLTGCIRTGSRADTQLQADSDLKPSSQVTHDCFEQLAPVGPLKGDQYSGVIATDGVCIGKGIAVSNLTQADEVTLVGPDGNNTKSAFYAKGEKVLVKVGDKTAEVGTIIDSDKGSEMKLAAGVSFEVRDNNIVLDINWN
jgi:hypothetical protein